MTIPRSLSFVKQSLFPEERVKWQEWYNTLSNPDKRNAGVFLREFHQWNERAKEEHPYASLNSDYFVISAIGSTARLSPEYHDVDLLIVTNRIWRDMNTISQLELALHKSFFHCDINPTMEDCYTMHGRPERTTMALLPSAGRRLHVTIQPEIVSEKDWNDYESDQKLSDRIVLYRTGDTVGYLDIERTFETLKQLQTALSGHLAVK